ncbi:glycosyltransferase [Herbiconiux sp. CPCC 205716]|uniref:Glycosyltransferase n=1 Tax=Herbiconiux gentiana TaxID=2970912 RepID=A0ABT2GL54_9MICO|nr:glycosyltransferase [Herbiconiux gentiana]MCS5716025.1 glycosyltransferase [Herbiconiux gentiana]
MTLPRLHVGGDPRHGVTRYAQQLADALGASAGAGHPDRLHLHFTDRLFGADPAAAATAVESLAASGPVTVTLHDVPQPSDGADGLRRRSEAYGRVVRAAAGVVVNSEHELGLLRRHVGVGAFSSARVAVIPLPVDPAPVSSSPPSPLSGAADAAPTVGVLGFVYPGKGHDRVIRAVAGLPGAVVVEVLGRASDGHERDLAALESLAGSLGVGFEVTGYLPDAALLSRSRTTTVPVIAHEHVSASGSLASWLGAGRRPVVVASPYMEEMAGLHEGALAVTTGEGLAAAIARALDDPASTWLDDGVRLGPDTAEVAGMYREFWRGVAW